MLKCSTSSAVDALITEVANGYDRKYTKHLCNLFSFFFHRVTMPGDRERARYESGRTRYDDIALHERRGVPPIEERRADRRAPPIDTRFPDDRRR